MGDSEYVPERMCDLHRQLIDEKIKAIDAHIEVTDEKVDGILEEIQGVRDLQKQILYTIIISLVLGLFTLVGVLLGRGIDFGFVVSQVI